MEEGSNGALFRIRDVYLWDKASRPEEEEEGPAFVDEESLQQQMRALGLPARFSSVPSKTTPRRPRRRNRTSSSLPDHFSQKLCADFDQSLPQSPLDSTQVRAVQLDRDNVPDSEASHCASKDPIRDHQEGESVYVSICDDHGETLLLGCGILALDARVQADVSTIDELGTVADSRGWLAYERARILDGGGPNGEKETIWPDLVNVSSGHCLEVDCKTKVSPDETNHCADEAIMASSRYHREGSSFLGLTSTEGACVSTVDHHGACNEEASLLSCGVIDAALSCGMVALEGINELGTVLNNRQPLAKEEARTSKNGDLKEEGICRITPTKDGSIVEATLRVSTLDITDEAVAISNSRLAAQDKQITTLSGSNQRVVDEGSIGSCEARAKNVLVKVTEQEFFSEDSQIEIPKVLSWSACWDNHYGRYYFYNTETLESTWEPPKGFESYAYTSAAEDNNEAFQGGPVNDVSNSEELVAKENKEERVSSEDGSKSGTLLHGPLEVEALPTVSAVKEALSSGNHSEILQSNLADGTDGNLPLRKVRAEGPEVALESSFCQVITYSANRSRVVQVDAVTSKDSEPTRRAKMAASWLVRLENQGMDIAAAMGDHSPTIFKYWAQRFRLFSKYDSGVKLDEEGWFSVTPEAIAKHQAARCRSGVIVDAFTGVGGNAIQFALAEHYVVAIDNDPKKIEYARHNAMIYGVADRIDFVLGDFFAVSSSMQADVIFLSPPWGGPDYLDVKVYDIQTMLQPKDGVSLFKVAQAVAPNIIFFLPRNVNMNQLAELSLSSSCSCEVERNYLNGKLKAVTAYYGQFTSMEETCS